MKMIKMAATSVLLITSIGVANADNWSVDSINGISGITTSLNNGKPKGPTTIGQYDFISNKNDYISAFRLDIDDEFKKNGVYKEDPDMFSPDITTRINYLFNTYLSGINTAEDKGLFGIALLEIVYDSISGGSINSGTFQIKSGLTNTQATTVNGIIQDVYTNANNTQTNLHKLNFLSGVNGTKSIVTWTNVPLDNVPTTGQVPEPGILALFGLGILIIAILPKYTRK